MTSTPRDCDLDTTPPNKVVPSKRTAEEAGEEVPSEGGAPEEDSETKEGEKGDSEMKEPEKKDSKMNESDDDESEEDESEEDESEEDEYKNPLIRELYYALDRGVHKDVVHHAFLQHFHDDLIDFHSAPKKFYARCISFFNSSGTGKSRLVRGIGTKMPTFIVTLNRVGFGGSNVPMPDDNVCDFFYQYGMEYPGQVVAAAFLSALFNRLYIHIAKTYKPKAGLKLTFPNRGVIGESQKMTQLAETKVISPNNGKMKLGKDILSPIYNSFSQDTKKRKYFLDSVVSLAGAILKRKCLYVNLYDYPSKSQSLPKGSTTVKNSTKVPKYIESTQLLDNLNRFFRLVDGTSGAVEQPDGTTVAKSNLTHQSLLEAKPIQFVLGIDGSHHLGSLIPRNANDSRDGKKGISAFTQLMYDLEHIQKEESSTVCKETEGRRRVWLILLSRSSETELLVPGETAKASSQGNPTAQLGTCWNNFGVDHFYKSVINANRTYWDKLTISKMHRFQHLSLFGRGTWITYGSELRWLCQRAVRKLLCERPELWKDISLFKVNGPRVPLSEVAFAVASLRFNTDTGIMTHRGDAAFFLILESIFSHMRVLDKIDSNGGVITSTPREPVLAVAALAILNYCHEIIERATLERNERFLEYTTMDGLRCDRAWKNLMMGMTVSLKAGEGVIKIDKAGKLLSRMILTRARDCTLPNKWDFAYGVPYTTLGRFIECLVDNPAQNLECTPKQDSSDDWEQEWSYNSEQDSSDDSEQDLVDDPKQNFVDDPKQNFKPSIKILKQLHLVNPRLCESLVNFNQFVPMNGPIHSQSIKYNVKGPLFHGQLLRAFGTSTALICHPKQPGINHVFPILVPKQVSQDASGSSEEILKMHENKTFEDYDLAYVGIDSKMTTIGQPPNEYVYSPEVQDFKGNVVQPCAAVVITMDMGTKDTFAERDGENKVDSESKKEMVCDFIKADVMQYRDTLNEEDESSQLIQKYLALRIRGVRKAYPNWASIDGDGLFEGAALEAVEKLNKSEEETSRDREFLPQFNPSKAEYQDQEKNGGRDPFLS